MGCLRCGNCCTRFGVCITPFDILRLAASTGLEPSDFVSLVADRPNRERKEPAILIDGSFWLLSLGRKKNEVCCLYSASGCSAYESRPMLCCCYPFVLEGEKLVATQSRACGEQWQLSPAEAEEYLHSAKQYLAEVNCYQKIALDWNKRGGGSLDQFLDFALAAASSETHRKS